MSLPQLLELFLVRQRRTFLTVFAVAFAVAIVVTFTLPREYKAQATLFVGENRPLAAGASAVQLDEVLARTYVQLLRTPDVERAVVRAMPFPITRSELEQKVGIEVVTGTRLIHMSALDRDPKRARSIADAYARTFVARQRESSADLSRDQQDTLRARIGELAQTVERLRGSAEPRDVAARARAETELQAARDAYVATAQSLALQGSNVSLASRADLPTDPSKPRPKLYLALGFILAVALGAGAALLRDRFDDRLRDEHELLALIDVPVLARIPYEEAGDKAATAEAFDILQANLRVIDAGRPHRMVGVTSPMPEEGKSFTASGLAGAYARLGARVLAVECDLRRPKLARYLGANADKGMTNLLVEPRRDADELSIPTAVRGIEFLPAGPLPPSPASLLGTARARTVLSDLRDRYDQLVVDTPPVTAGADLTALGPALDGLILVVDLGHSGRTAIIAARDQIERSGARLLGVVLNRVRAWDRRYGLEDYAGYVPTPVPENGTARRRRRSWVSELIPRVRDGLDRLSRPQQPRQER